MATAKRNYQTVIFNKHTSTRVTYRPADNSVSPPIPSLDAIIYTPVHDDGSPDTETKRAFVMLKGGGGSVFPSMEWVATPLCNVGYVCAEFDTGSSTNEFDVIAHAGCFNRFMHSKHKIYGIIGSKFFGDGDSLGGATMWAQNICLDVILTDPRFANPVNDLYPNAKMNLLGSASMPGSVDDIIFRLINATSVAHLDSHGDRDTVLPIAGAQAAIDQMNKFGVKSRLDVYPGAGHGLDGLHDIIIQTHIIWFAALMNIPPINPTS